MIHLTAKFTDFTGHLNLKCPTMSDAFYKAVDMMPVLDDADTITMERKL